jgi:hypothetical protein
MAKSDDVKSLFDDAWLGLGDVTALQVLNNPMIHRSEI